MAASRTQLAIKAIKSKTQSLVKKGNNLIVELERIGWTEGEPVYPELAFKAIVVHRNIDGMPREPYQEPPRREVPYVKLPLSLTQQYHVWYSGCHTLVAANLPARTAELAEVHEKHLAPFFKHENMAHYQQIPAVRNIAIMQGIIGSIPQYLDLSAYDIDLLLAASYVKDQLAEAATLFSIGHERAAGALAGVLLERHLKLLCNKHQPIITYPHNAAISNLNDLLQKHAVYDRTQWTRVDWMRQVRNSCDHAGSTAPNSSNVDTLITEVGSFVQQFAV